MATISATGSNGHHSISLEVISQTQTPANNSTTILYFVRLASVSNGYGWNYDTNPFVCTYTINGVTRTCTCLSYSGSGTVILASDTQKVIHNADGTKTLDFSFSVTSNDDPNLIGSCSSSGYLSLTTISRVSTFSVPSGTHVLGTEMTITVNRQVNTYAHTLRYSCGTESGVIGSEKITSSSIRWTPPGTLATQNPSGSTLQCTLTLTTYTGTDSSASLVGSQTQTITLSISISAPTFTLSVSDISDYDSGHSFEYITGYYLKNKSIMKAEMSNIVCSNGATIKSGSITIRKNDSTGDIIAQGTAKTLQWNVNWTGTVYIVGTITDSRGFSRANETTVSLISDYADPVPNVTVGRYNDSSGTVQDDGGEYCKITYSGTYTQIGTSGSHNSGRITVKYKLHSASTWEVPIERSSTLSGTYIFAADQNMTYDVAVEMSDTLYGKTKTVLLATAVSLMDWRGDGKAVTFGGPNTMTNALEIRWPKIIINSSSPQFVAQGSGATSLHFIRDDYNAESLIYQWASSDNPGVSFGLKAQGDSEYTYPAAITKDGIRPYSANSFSLGLSNVPWLNIFGGTIYEGGTSLANKYNAKIVKITDSSGSTTVASGSYVQCSSKAIPTAGYYMVVGYQDWASGFTGTTTFRIVQKRGTTSQSTWAWRHDATGGGGISGVALLQIAANDTINTEVYQSSGSNKTARTYIYAFRLMD